MAELRNEYGSAFDSKLAGAIALVNSYPDLAAWLDKTKNGDNPAVIRKIIQIASNKKAQGRLNAIYRMGKNR